LTPIAAYRRLVAPDPREAPSFLLESVEGGERLGRYSIMGARPILRVLAREGHVAIEWHTKDAFALLVRAGLVEPDTFGDPSNTNEMSDEGLLDTGLLDLGVLPDPLDILRRISAPITLLGQAHSPRVATPGALPACVLGGWFGYAAYDAVRYTEPGKLPFTSSPKDDRNLPDVDFALYTSIVAFDHVARLAHLVTLALVWPESTSQLPVHAAALASLDELRALLDAPGPHVSLGTLTPASVAGTSPSAARESTSTSTNQGVKSNMTREQHAAMLTRALEYIRAGDAFQIVLGQRFEKKSHADPFDVYRALRSVNPSPYMAYFQGAACVLVASSPEILCRVRHELGNQGRLIVTNRPLAGTRKRGATPEEDAALERELLADPKERAEHAMLVDLGRNDVGRVAEPGTVKTPTLMDVERYSHVMHISSTVTGTIREGLDAWDALRAALPVGTISGAPKVRAMEIIDELEPVRRGPYGGGLGYVGLDGAMDIALALRTIVVPHGFVQDSVVQDGVVQASVVQDGESMAEIGEIASKPRVWTYHMQASGGIVADSVPHDEFMETVNKAAALARALELAERAFG